MGCNIHGVVEIRRKEWEHLCDMPWRRDYFFYAQVAGVRNDYDVKPIAEPRGIPNDACYDTHVTYKQFMKDTGGHSASYLDAKETQSVSRGIYRTSGDVSLTPIWRAWLEFIHVLGVCYGFDNVRMVFWFDN